MEFSEKFNNFAMSSNQSSAAVVSRPGTPSASEEYIASLAGRYNTTLQGPRTISGTAASWKFNSYAYTYIHASYW